MSTVLKLVMEEKYPDYSHADVNKLRLFFKRTNRNVLTCSINEMYVSGNTLQPRVAVEGHGLFMLVLMEYLLCFWLEWLCAVQSCPQCV